VKPEKPTGKKEQDQEMRMPAKEFDRIMGGVLGASEEPRKPGSGLGRNRIMEKMPPALQETEDGPSQDVRPPFGAPAREPKTPPPKPPTK
jgi:hypothetical protein